MIVLNVFILFYFNDKYCYRKCYRIEIFVNYVYYDNIYFKSY